ncbi:MAG: hypothetical protein GXX94_11670 [Chloroflexi bacterium]|nr:hypothetical protein [Chloroflexota bacterium]
MDQLQTAAARYAKNGEISCPDAHRLAAELGMTPGQLGKAITESTEFRFYRCQLGVFGYGPKPEGLSKIILPAKHVPPAIRAEIESVTVDGKLPCAEVWAIADRNAYPRLGLANIVEAMGLRVIPCQLGCF